MEDNEEEINDEKAKNLKVKVEEIPKTLSQLYMLNRQQMLLCRDEFTYYRHLLESIRIGSAILGNENPELAKETRDILSGKDIYPNIRSMDFHPSTKTYSCSSGTIETGKVTVRPEELVIGEESVRNQQAGYTIRFLAPLDDRIFVELLERKWIRKGTLGEEIEREFLKEVKNFVNE